MTPQPLAPKQPKPKLDAARAELLNTREELGAIRVILATEQNSLEDAITERNALREELSFNRALVDKGGRDILMLLGNTVELQAECDALRNAAHAELADCRDALQDWQVAAGTRQSEVDALRKRIAKLTICDCGLPLSTGLCGICDNDE